MGNETTVACPLCWFDIPFDDEARGKKFYSEVFGFELDKYEGAPVPYYMMKKSWPTKPPKSDVGGGLLPRMHPEHAPLLYFAVPSLKEWEAKVEEHGGQVIQPDNPVGDMGIFSVCLDSEGNTIAIYQNLQKS